jgi:hypothetical protein
MVNYDFFYDMENCIGIYFFELLCANGLEFVSHKCTINTFETLDPFDTRHGILGKKFSSHSNGELF